MQVIENEIMGGYQRDADKPGNDIYSTKLHKISKVRAFFDFDNP